MNLEKPLIEAAEPVRKPCRNEGDCQWEPWCRLNGKCKAAHDFSGYNAPFCHQPLKCGPVGRCLRERACND